MAQLLENNELLIKFLDHIKDLPQDVSEAMQTIRNLDDECQPKQKQWEQYESDNKKKLDELLHQLKCVAAVKALELGNLNIDEVKNIIGDDNNINDYNNININDIENQIELLKDDAMIKLKEMHNDISRLTTFKIEAGKALYQRVDTHIRRLDTQLKKYETSLRKNRFEASADAINLRERPFESQNDILYMLAAISNSNDEQINSITEAAANRSKVLRAQNESLDTTEHTSTHILEPLYCICNQPSYGEMISCDNEDDCEKEWFHFGCVGLASKPKGSWYCPDCKAKRKERLEQQRASLAPPKKKRKKKRNW